MTESTTPITTEHVRCDLCGSDDPAPVVELQDVVLQTSDDTFQLVRCRNCDLLYLNPRPAPESLQRSYPPQYTPFTRSRSSRRLKRCSLVHDVEQLWPLLAPPRRVLDLGCATGELLQIIRERGNPNVLGVEPSDFAAEVARQRGLDVMTGQVPGVELASESIDSALLSHVLEHLPSPSATVAELRRIMRPGGALVIWLPNARSLARQALGADWIGYDAPRHLYNFTPDTLRCLLEKHGFRIRSICHEWSGLEWAWGVRLQARRRFGPGADRWLAAAHPALLLALTPVGIAATLLRRSGRIRVVALKS